MRALVVDEVLPGGALAVEVAEETPDYVLGALGRLVVLRTRSVMSPASVSALFELTTSAMDIYGPHILYVVLPGARHPQLTDETRERLEQVWPKIQAQSEAGVVWIRNPGFAGVLNRNQVAEVLPVLRHRSLLGVTSSAAETVAFLQENAPSFDVDPHAWALALEAFAVRYDRP